MFNRTEISVLKGKTLIKVDGGVGDAAIKFVTSDGEMYEMLHEQDCCESVYVQDINGHWDDLIGRPLLVAEEVSNIDTSNVDVSNLYSYTWTFYRLATDRGWVVIRWLGESNGYYSESVSFIRTL